MKNGLFKLDTCTGGASCTHRGIDGKPLAGLGIHCNFVAYADTAHEIPFDSFFSQQGGRITLAFAKMRLGDTMTREDDADADRQLEIASLPSNSPCDAALVQSFSRSAMTTSEPKLEISLHFDYRYGSRQLSTNLAVSIPDSLIDSTFHSAVSVLMSIVEMSTQPASPRGSTAKQPEEKPDQDLVRFTEGNCVLVYNLKEHTLSFATKDTEDKPTTHTGILSLDAAISAFRSWWATTHVPHTGDPTVIEGWLKQLFHDAAAP